MRTFITRLLAILAFTAAILGSCYGQSNAAPATPGNCMYTGFTNSWGTEDEEIDLVTLFENAGWYPTRQCWVDGARIYHTAANTRHEVFMLKDIYNDSRYDKRFNLPLVWCQVDERNAYLMAERWLFSRIQHPTAAKVRNWNRFANDWVRTHDECVLGH